VHTHPPHTSHGILHGNFRLPGSPSPINRL
jgi:hypothetical protein